MAAMKHPQSETDFVAQQGMKTKFDLSRIHELLRKGNDLAVPRAANELTWLTNDYMDHLKSRRDQHPTWLDERRDQERDAADAFINLIDNDEAWDIVKRLVPEFRDSGERYVIAFYSHSR
jgi:hypothetical protein